MFWGDECALEVLFLWKIEEKMIFFEKNMESVLLFQNKALPLHRN